MLSSFSNTILVLNFTMHQAEIEKAFCINKAKPQLKCHGKCHLKKELVAKNEHKNQPTPESQLEEAFKFTFFHQPIIKSVNQELKDPQPIYSVVVTDIFSRLFGKSIFQPPDIQLVA